MHYALKPTLCVRGHALKPTLCGKPIKTPQGTLPEVEDRCIHPASLTSLSIADNQLDAFSGHGVACLLERNKGTL